MNFIRIFFVRNIINILENIFYEKKLLKLYKELFVDGSLKEFFDVGVNRGQSIKLIKKINNKVNIIGFEPNPKLFSYLKKKYSKNRNIKLYNLGCSDSEGKRLFYENILDESSGFEKINYDSNWVKKKSMILGVSPKKLVAEKYYVKVIAISEFYKSKKTIDLVKIDVEGHEYMVLKGLFKNSMDIRFIQIEIHKDNMYKNKVHYNKIIRILKKNGFSEYREIRHSFGKFYDIIFKKN